MTAMDKLLQEIADQIDWIESHGRTLAGYVARYGAADSPDKFGDGGEAIHAADVAALDNLLTLGRRYRGTPGGRVLLDRARFSR